MVNGGVVVNGPTNDSFSRRSSPRRLPNRVVVDNALILDAIRYHRFGVAVQVIHGIQTIGSRTTQKRKVRQAKMLLEEAVGDTSVIKGGVATTQNNQRSIGELDFSLQVNNYEPQLLRTVAKRCLESSKYLREGDQRELSRIVSKSYTSGAYEIVKALSSTPGKGERGDSVNRLCRIREKVLVRYVHALFESTLSDHHVFAIGANLQNRYESRTINTGLIIAANPSDFDLALRRISGRHKKGYLSIDVTSKPTQQN